MGRSPVASPEHKIRIVLSLVSGQSSIAEAARREKVTEQSISRWRNEFLAAGKAALRAGPTTREEQLE